MGILRAQTLVKVGKLKSGKPSSPSSRRLRLSDVASAGH